MSPTLERSGGVFAGPVRAASKGSFAAGVILFILGILGLIFADVVTVASVIAFGVLLVIAGAVEVGQALRQQGGDRFFLPLLSGLLSIAVGAVLILRPAVGVAGSAVLIAGWLLATGLFRGVLALVHRYRFWGWDLFYGVLSVVLGVWLLASLPTSAMWLLGTMVAVELMARGVAMMGVSMALGRLERASVPTG